MLNVLCHGSYLLMLALMLHNKLYCNHHVVVNVDTMKEFGTKTNDEIKGILFTVLLMLCWFMFFAYFMMLEENWVIMMYV